MNLLSRKCDKQGNNCVFTTCMHESWICWLKNVICKILILYVQHGTMNYEFVHLKGNMQRNNYISRKCKHESWICWLANTMRKIIIVYLEHACMHYEFVCQKFRRTIVSLFVNACMIDKWICTVQILDTLFFVLQIQLVSAVKCPWMC